MQEDLKKGKEQGSLLLTLLGWKKNYKKEVNTFFMDYNKTLNYINYIKFVNVLFHC